LVASDLLSDDPSGQARPSYLHFRIFREILPTHKWRGA
jgi:hypothetical protein